MMIMIYAQPTIKCRSPTALESEQDVFVLPPPIITYFLLGALFLSGSSPSDDLQKGDVKHYFLVLSF